jgi:hypothetical protein
MQHEMCAIEKLVRFDFFFLCLLVTGLKKAKSEGKKCHAKTMTKKKSRKTLK